MVCGVEEGLQEIEDVEIRTRARRRITAIVKDISKKNETNGEEEERGLRKIAARKDIVIEQADKGGILLMDRV